MAVFTYKAFDASARPTSGTLVADTPRQAREQLFDRGMTVHEVTLRPVRHSFTRAGSRSTRGGVAGGGDVANAGTVGFGFRRRHSADSVQFVRDLSTLLGVGVPLLDALQTLTRQQSRRFQSVVLQLQDKVASGASLAAAMREQPGVFDHLDVNITEVGESVGNLETVLSRLADFKESAAAVRGRVASALLYPCIVFVVAIGVSLLLMTFVVPKLLGTLIEAGRPIPLVTRIVKALSDAIISHWWEGLIVLTMAVVGAGYALSTVQGRRAWDRWQLRFPLIGSAMRKQSIARIAVVISTLMRSGIVFIKAVQIARETTPNSVLRDALSKCETAVASGSDIAAAVGSTGAFPPMVVQMFAIGQQSGKLEDVLERLAVDYDRQVKTLTTQLTTILEPVLILFMVVLVGFIAFATLLPMLEAADVF